jgi:DNA-binding NarL/FixJ family response regulator
VSPAASQTGLGFSDEPQVINPILQVAVIAPEQMLGVFAVLIQSAPRLDLIASATTFESLPAQLGKRPPDAVLIYLVRERTNDNGTAEFREIGKLKLKWPNVSCVAIVKFASQQEEALRAGAQVALVEGVSAERLLAAIAGDLE